MFSWAHGNRMAGGTEPEWALQRMAASVPAVVDPARCWRAYREKGLRQCGIMRCKCELYFNSRAATQSNHILYCNNGNR